MDRLVALSRALDSATSFEHASDLTLGAVLATAEAAVQRSEYAKTGKVLRAMVHLRPDDGYLRLVGLEAGRVESGCQVGEGTHLPSATTWRWVRSYRVPISVDVSLDMVLAFEADSFAPPRVGDTSADMKASRLRLVGRDVTHLLAIPLRLAGGRIEGMIAVEAACPQARATAFAWDLCVEEMEKLAAVAGPYLAGLPITRVAITQPDTHLPVIGKSMQHTIEMLSVFAKLDETVLLGGPTGAGKSRLATWCHHRSPRHGQHLETLDLATIPEDLQMAELFGWRKGAFTGAEKNTPGAIARAERGTLFIDEIDKLSLKAQAGLLRVLEDRQYRPLGEGDRKANVRFIIGTNADLMELIHKGQFREDLYYRINVLPVRVLRLADRIDEIIPWARHMVARRHEASGANASVELADAGARKLQTQDWPGNLRQLDNIVRRAYALALVDAGGAEGPLTIGLSHVEHALAQEVRPGRGTTWDMIERAAEAFVAEAERRAELGDRLDMDLVDGMKGLVIEVAKRRKGGAEPDSVRHAYILLGKESTVKDRNHTAAYKREQSKLEALRRALSLGESQR